MVAAEHLWKLNHVGQRYDIIGDVHGHADALRRLLIKLGYTESQGAFRHDTRKAIFVGDFVDRGPQPEEVLGSHEICAKPERPAQYWAIMSSMQSLGRCRMKAEDFSGRIRKKTPNNMKNFFANSFDGSQNISKLIQWFRDFQCGWILQISLWSRACWHEPSIAILRSCLDGRNCFTEVGLRKALQRGSETYRAAEILMKGPEAHLPPGVSFLDKMGFPVR